MSQSNKEREQSTDRRRSLYENIFNSQLIGYALLDQDRIILEANEQAGRMIGLLTDELLGKDFSELICPRDRAPFIRDFEDFFERENRLELQLQMTTRDFLPLPVAIEGAIITGPGREAPQARLALIDLEGIRRSNEESGGTDLLEQRVKERTAELDRLKFEAEAANRAKSEFLANMNHELRTPLNSIIGFSQIIAQGMVGPVNDLQKEYINDIISSGHHLLSLINDILDLSKIETNQITIEREAFSAGELIEQCLAMFKEKFMQKNICLNLSMDDDPGEIIADERRIKQVIINLLSNAYKFSARNGKIGLEVSRDHGRLRIAVWDTGPGIPKDDISRLFRPFCQLDNSPFRTHEGTGLGLFLCRRIIELHSGMIWAESAPDQGSRFTFVIPAIPYDHHAENSAAARPASSPKPFFNEAKAKKHFERLKSLTNRRDMGLGLLRFELIPESHASTDPATTENILLGLSRKYEFFIRTPINNIYDLVLVAPEKLNIHAIIQRYSTGLKKYGYLCLARYAFFPEHGETVDKLRETVELSGYLFMNPDSAPDEL